MLTEQAYPLVATVGGILVGSIIGLTWWGARQHYYVHPRRPLRIEFDGQPDKSLVFGLGVRNAYHLTVKNVSVEIGPADLFPEWSKRLLILRSHTQRDTRTDIHPRQSVLFNFFKAIDHKSNVDGIASSMALAGTVRMTADAEERPAGHVEVQGVAISIPIGVRKAFIVAVRADDCDAEYAQVIIDTRETPKVLIRRRAELSRREKKEFDTWIS